MNIEDFFKTRMRNQCSDKECDAVTEWRNSMEEVFQDTINLEWKLTEQVEPPKRSGGNITITSSAGTTTSSGSGSLTIGNTAGSAINISSTNTGSVVNFDDQDSVFVFDTKLMEMSLGTIKVEFIGTRWYCKDCVYKIRLKNLLA